MCKSFAGKPAVDAVSLNIRQGEILALVGPSGCGKTTTLRLIAGFEELDAGEILMNGHRIAGPGGGLPPEKRRIGVVFQDQALFPHLTVRENVAFGLQHLPKAAQEEIVDEMLALVDLDGYADRYPHQLSGGERQRVALVRSLAPQPVLLLLDEPFSRLDAELRLKLRADVRDVLGRLNMTAVFVTHDQEEALFMGDRVALMNEGHIYQIDTPEEIYSHPANRFVAEFMGNATFLPGVVSPEGIRTEIGIVPQKVDLPLGAGVDLAVRADDIALLQSGQPNARIVARDFKGVLTVYRVRLPSGKVLETFQPHYSSMQAGDPVCVLVNPGHELAWFPRDKQ